MLDFFKCGHFKDIPIYHPKDTPEDLRSLPIIFTDPMAYKNTAKNLHNIWHFTGDTLQLDEAFPFINNDDMKQENEKMYKNWLLRVNNF